MRDLQDTAALRLLTARRASLRLALCALAVSAAQPVSLAQTSAAQTLAAQTSAARTVPRTSARTILAGPVEWAALPLGEAGAAQEYAAAALPDSPGTIAALSSSSSTAAAPEPAQETDPQKRPGGAKSPLPRAASPTDLTVAAGQVAPPQTARDKAVGSLKDTISPFSLIGNVVSAGYSHAVDSSPNYGVDGNAFAQRFGAAVARGASQNLFSNGALAILLHEDTRYYQLGPGHGPDHSFVQRSLHAGIQPLVSRTDSGKRTPNFALLGGYLGAAALTQTYYPSRNQSTGDVFSIWGGSVAGAAIGYAVDEFLPQVLQAVHLKKVE